VTYNEFATRMGFNPDTQQMQSNPYHDISVDVFRPEAVS
jgi:hypothetical protein